MIARHEHPQADVWSRIAAPLPPHAIEARLDSKPKESRNTPGQYFGRFLLYVRAQYVVQRLDEVVPGEWDFSLTSEAQPFDTVDREGVVTGRVWYVRGRMQILGVIREDYGQGKDPKEAATDALKRCAMRFGIAAELYYAETLFVPVDGEGKYAKPTVDPVAEYARRFGGLPRLPHKADDVARANAGATSGGAGASAQTNGKSAGAHTPSAPASGTVPPEQDEPPFNDPEPAAPAPRASDEPPCPKCGGRMWDNRTTKRNPKAPDYKCRSRSCDGVVWPSKGEQREPDARGVDGQPEYADSNDFNTAGGDDLPF